MNSPILASSHSPFIGYGFENGRFFTQHSIAPLEEMQDDESQVPTPAEFNAIVDDYLNNLSPKKRDKALVDQQRYCLIQQVLKDPRNTAISTAQFRFWVKKMFHFQPGSMDLVCHDKKPVAMKEQIYGILVRAHRDAHHGGRDKTSALVRKQFSWIPKELVARFVRHCPFCIIRRNGGQNPSVFGPKLSSVRIPGYVTRPSFSSFDAPSIVYTPSLQEDSDISSGPSSAENGYETSPNYPSISSSPPRRPSQNGFFNQNSSNPLYDQEEEDLLQGYQYSSPLQRPIYSNANFTYSKTANQPSNQPSRQPQQPTPSAPQSPLFYQQGYLAYQPYVNPYYPNVLGITPCAPENQNQPVTAFIRPTGTDILTHNQDHPSYLNPIHSFMPTYPSTNSSETTFAANDV